MEKIVQSFSLYIVILHFIILGVSKMENLGAGIELGMQPDFDCI